MISELSRILSRKEREQWFTNMNIFYIVEKMLAVKGKLVKYSTGKDQTPQNKIYGESHFQWVQKQ